jgi:hypothetical protein
MMEASLASKRHALTDLLRSPLAIVTLIGISLLILAISFSDLAGAEPPPNGRAQVADDAAAARVLGQDLPRPRAQGSLVRSELAIVPSDPAIRAVAMVNQAFAIADENVALLTVFRGTMGESNPGATDEVIELVGARTEVTVRSGLNGSTMIGYRWSRHGLVYNLHVTLSHGIDRAFADRIAASIP